EELHPRNMSLPGFSQGFFKLLLTFPDAGYVQQGTNHKGCRAFLIFFNDPASHVDPDVMTRLMTHAQLVFEVRRAAAGQFLPKSRKPRGIVGMDTVEHLFDRPVVVIWFQPEHLQGTPSKVHPPTGNMPAPDSHFTSLQDLPQFLAV